VKAGLVSGHYTIVAIALAVSLLTTFSMTKIWAEAFWKPSTIGPQSSAESRPSPALILPIIALAALVVIIGLAAEPVFVLSSRAAEQLLDPALYIETVLGGSH
jgi:multicomponent Na+:H+ antiporter subunit D